MADDKKRIVLKLFEWPELKAVMSELRLKTGMRNDQDIIMLALKQLNTRLPGEAEPAATLQ